MCDVRHAMTCDVFMCVKLIERKRRHAGCRSPDIWTLAGALPGARFNASARIKAGQVGEVHRMCALQCDVCPTV